MSAVGQDIINKMLSAQELLETKLRQMPILSGISIRVDIPEVKFGDYTTNAGMVAAKAAGQNPIKLAQELAENLNKDPDIKKTFSKIEAVPPGFINFYLSTNYIAENLNGINKDPEAYGASDIGKGKLVLVEYFQLNAAKPPHIAHLRSAVIGDSLKRVFKALGYKTVSDTHIGDWGTQFGILLWAYKNLDGRHKVKDNPLEELNELYVEANKMMGENDELREQAKQEFVKLERGDKENKKLWQFFVSISNKEIGKMVKRLNLLEFEYELGESFYEDLMKEVLDKLEQKHLLKTGETGERYVNLEEFNLGRMICVKTDGGTTYGLRDLATLYYRYETLYKKERSTLAHNIYVVDTRQSHHLSQVFKVFELLGEYDVQKSTHVDFGYMKLPEGAISTRKGNIIHLEKLLEEADTRALDVINSKNPNLRNKEKIASVVGLGAVKYADLSHNRKGDVIFRWDEVLSFEGDTGPYLQYTHARLRSILRKANTKPAKISDIPEGPELIVLRKLVHFPEIVTAVSTEFLPNILANYLYELASDVNNFYHSVHVLQEKDKDLQNLRLNVVSASANVLKSGLYLLGIDAPDEM